jgi:hypothetical protein
MNTDGDLPSTTRGFGDGPIETEMGGLNTTNFNNPPPVPAHNPNTFPSSNLSKNSRIGFIRKVKFPNIPKINSKFRFMEF